MLDEPTSTTPDSTPSNDTAPDGAAEPVKAPRRRRATKAAAPAGPAQDDTAPATGRPAASPDAPAEVQDVASTTGSQAQDGEAPAPAKRVRKAPAKKAAAPRKRTAKAAAEADPDAAPANETDESTTEPVTGAAVPSGEDVPLTEEELAAQAALLEAAGLSADPAAELPTPATADDAVPEKAKRTRSRRTAAVTFQAPEQVELPAAPSSEQSEDPDEPAAPKRRRRAGTSGVVSPADLVPQLLEPAVSDDDVAPQDRGPSDDEDDDDRPRRRRRGRRGRGPRRPEDENENGNGDEDATATPGDAPSADAPATDASATDAEGADAEDGDDEGGTRRRRRRRRGGSGGGGETATEEREAPAARERAPRQRSGATSADDDGVRGISGSTRMAAKRVRRQEGRDSGRKRQPVLSEAEFLARREAVDRTMVVRQKGDRTQIAVLEDGVLVEHYVTKASAQAYAGNVYLGRVQNVLPSMEAAFVDIGKSRNAVLYAGEVNYNASVGGRSRSIESVLKGGQEVLVQVSKDPIGHKGARLTGQVSLPGRYLVYVPEGSMTGISRKLPDTERDRLKKILKKVVPDDAGVIIRTAAEGASEEEIAGDVRRLQAQWEVIQTKAAKGGAPALLQAEPDLVVRVVRDVFNEDFTTLLVQGDSEWDTIREYVEFVAPDLAPRLKRHTSDKDVFAEHRIDEQLLKALDRKVYLPSGGSLVIDRTEAMVVIDVNTGKYVGKGGNLEETVTRNNLEAAEEIARQLRLRDVGGIIVVDFIDMVLESNRDLVVRRLVECLGRDRTKHQVAEVTSLGLVQMTRKRVGQGLLEAFSEPCEACNGRGVHVHSEPVDERRGGEGRGADGRGGEARGGRGGERGEDEPRRERAAKPRVSKPLPADAPKPGAGISAKAEAEAAAADGAAGVSEAGPGDATQDDGEQSPAPRRRRRGGRGSGAATVAASDELAELLADSAAAATLPGLPSQAAAVSAATAPPAPGDDPDAGVSAPENELASGAVSSDVAAPGEAASVEVAATEAASVEDAATEPRTDAVGGSVDSSVNSSDDDDPAAAPASSPVDEPQEAAPKRRRRATSRPAGPPA